MLLVTFDSNVWRPVSSPNRFPKDRDFVSFEIIHKALQTGKIGGRLSETVFTLEAIECGARKSFFENYPRTAHPGNNPYLSSHWADALALGFRLMRCPRVQNVKNLDLNDEWFDSTSTVDSLTRASRFGEVSRKIVAAGAGYAAVQQISARYSSVSVPWHFVLDAVPPSEINAFAKAVAEWADGDAVAAHISYGNHFFCTRDIGKSAGSSSVFSPSNRAWLERDYGIVFVKPEELVSQLSL